ADAQGVRPQLRDDQTDDVTGEHTEHAEVEQGAADAQQLALVELRGAGGPPELVIAPAPDVPDDEGRQAQVRNDDPEEFTQRGAPTGMVGPRSARADGWGVGGRAAVASSRAGSIA